VSLDTIVSFAKEPYKKDYILQKRPTISRRLLIVALVRYPQTKALDASTPLARVFRTLAPLDRYPLKDKSPEYPLNVIQGIY